MAVEEQHEFYLVDVFASERYAGNQLAVFMNGHLYSSTQMQRIAREFNFSEVAFFFPRDSRDGLYRVRIFTPVEELPFAGHPTLGTAYVLLKYWLKEPRAQITLDLPVGPIPVQAEYGPLQSPGEASPPVPDVDFREPSLLIMRQNPPQFGSVLDRKEVAKALGLVEADLDPRYPVQIVSTGLPFVIAPLRDLEAARRAWMQPSANEILAQKYGCRDVLIFCPETVNPGARLHVRVFVPFLQEDPATGSGNGCLAAYLAKHDYDGLVSNGLRTESHPGCGGTHLRTFEIWAEQGVEMGRPSLLYLRASIEDGEKAGQPSAWQPHTEAKITVEIGGQVISVGRGFLDL